MYDFYKVLWNVSNIDVLFHQFLQATIIFHQISLVWIQAEWIGSHQIIEWIKPFNSDLKIQNQYPITSAIWSSLSINHLALYFLSWKQKIGTSEKFHVMIWNFSLINSNNLLLLYKTFTIIPFMFRNNSWKFLGKLFLFIFLYCQSISDSKLSIMFLKIINTYINQ